MFAAISFAIFDSEGVKWSQTTKVPVCSFSPQCWIIFTDTLPCSRKTKRDLKFQILWTLNIVSTQGLTLSMGNMWACPLSGWGSSSLTNRQNGGSPWWTPPPSLTWTSNPSRYPLILTFSYFLKRRRNLTCMCIKGTPQNSSSLISFQDDIILLACLI